MSWKTRSLAATLFVLTALTVSYVKREQAHGTPGEDGGSAPPTPTVNLTLNIMAEGLPVPARVELRDANGVRYIAGDALLVGGHGEDIYEELDLDEFLATLSRRFRNPYTEVDQCYSDGVSHFSVPAGTFTLRVFKGPEYRVYEDAFTLVEGDDVVKTAELTRWVNMPLQGWHSSDGHLHIPRIVSEMNDVASKWMRAEDIHVPNFLQMGSLERFFNSPQYAFGPDGEHEEAGTIIVSGQEQPRSFHFGHAIVLGGMTAINFPGNYHLFSLFFQEAENQGAVAGYAHWGYNDFPETHGLIKDLGINSPVRILEVGQDRWLHYKPWYDALNLGFRVTPTAGTDYPCIASIPGRERFYTKVNGSLSIASWLEGIRQGRTFVTSGPMLTLSVNGADIGGEVFLDAAGTVDIQATVRWDAAQDDIRALELVKNGEVVMTFPRREEESIAFEIPDFRVDATSWLAVSAIGSKVGENNDSGGHTGAIYVTIHGAPGLREQITARRQAWLWLQQLGDLKKRWGPDQIFWLSSKEIDPDAPIEYWRRIQPFVYQEIEEAENFYNSLDPLEP